MLHPLTSRTLRPSRVCAAVVAGLAIIAAAQATLAAHDMWIEPAAFMPQPGQVVALRLRVGQGLLGDPLAHDARLIREFIVDDGSGRKPVVAREGGDPAGLIRPLASGLAVVGYYSTPSVVELTPEKFNQYVEEEGLDAVAAERAKRRLLAAGGRDAFTRCAKSLVLTGASSPDQQDRALGFPLELVAGGNPCALDASRDLPVTLTWQGRPLAGVLVQAMNRKNPAEVQRQRTDRNGRVSFHVGNEGTWLIKAVHMQLAAGSDGHDWESYWASLTFAAPAASMAPRATALAPAANAGAIH